MSRGWGEDTSWTSHPDPRDARCHPCSSPDDAWGADGDAGRDGAQGVAIYGIGDHGADGGAGRDGSRARASCRYI